MNLYLKKFGIPESQGMEVVNLNLRPSPTVMAGGLGGIGHGQYWIEETGGGMATTATDKPPYRVPLMPEVEAIPWNGYKVASTFSGTGGSCLGYRMAGFRVVWSNEFIKNAQQCYKLNHPKSILDKRDIRQVQPEEILHATGLEKGELDLFDGSPPCDSFSTAGVRDKGWGKVKQYMGGERVQRTDDLTWEWLRLLTGLQPKTFVMENVSGLVKGRAKGMFKLIIRDARAAGYRVACRVLDAQWLGVPQARQRTIFVGVRNDIGLDPVHPSPLPYRYTVRDALELVKGARVIHDTSGKFSNGDITDKPSCSVTTQQQWFVETESPAIAAERDNRGAFGKAGTITDDPAPSVLAGTQGNLWIRRADKTRRKFTIPELRRICSFPDDFQFVGPYAKQWERMGMSVPPVMMSHVAVAVRDKILNQLES